MIVKELLATLLTLPQEAEICTEQWSSNEIAEMAFSEAENLVIIGDDLDEVRDFYSDMVTPAIKDTPTAATLKYEKTIGKETIQRTYLFCNREAAMAAAKVLIDKVLERYIKRLNTQDGNLDLFIYRTKHSLCYTDDSRNEKTQIWVEDSCFCDDANTVLADFAEPEAHCEKK